MPAISYFRSSMPCAHYGGARDSSQIRDDSTLTAQAQFTGLERSVLSAQELSGAGKVWPRIDEVIVCPSEPNWIKPGREVRSPGARTNRPTNLGEPCGIPGHRADRGRTRSVHRR